MTACAQSATPQQRASNTTCMLQYSSDVCCVFVCLFVICYVSSVMTDLVKSATSAPYTSRRVCHLRTIPRPRVAATSSRRHRHRRLIGSIQRLRRHVVSVGYSLEAVRTVAGIVGMGAIWHVHCRGAGRCKIIRRKGVRPRTALPSSAFSLSRIP